MGYNKAPTPWALEAFSSSLERGALACKTRQMHKSEMPKSFSIDLREKVVAAIDRKEGTQRGLAKVFGVSL
jgi:hypothetical protein